MISAFEWSSNITIGSIADRQEDMVLRRRLTKFKTHRGRLTKAGAKVRPSAKKALTDDVDQGEDQEQRHRLPPRPGRTDRPRRTHPGRFKPAHSNREPVPHRTRPDFRHPAEFQGNQWTEVTGISRLLGCCPFEAAHT